MIRVSVFLILLLVLSAETAKAQYNTGSDDLNMSLVKIDAQAGVNFGAFQADLVGSYNISKSKIDYLSLKVGMSAGDIYMTVKIAKMLSVDIDQVVEVYRIHSGKGWGVMAKELGIKPGSAEFHALKGSASKKAKGPKQSNKSKGKKG
jgi:hypothetical protein